MGVPWTPRLQIIVEGIKQPVNDDAFSICFHVATVYELLHAILLNPVEIYGQRQSIKFICNQIIMFLVYFDLSFMQKIYLSDELFKENLLLFCKNKCSDGLCKWVLTRYVEAYNRRNNSRKVSTKCFDGSDRRRRLAWMREKERVKYQ